MAICPLAIPILVLILAGCDSSGGYPSRPITIICPWAAGGGTDRVSRQMAMFLERELGTPVSVVNATGGKGVTGHNRGLSARPDGYTLTMLTFELNTMRWAGLTDLTYESCIPLVSVNEDYAALLVRTDATWKTLDELESEVRETPQKLTASGTAVGGAWHLALAGWLVAAGVSADDVVWVPSQGANPSLQQLISGGVDMVCCSLPEARLLLDGGQVRALGLMAPQRARGFEDVPTFREQGRDWTLGGWRGLGVPKGTPDPIVDRLVTTIEAIVSQAAQEGNFANFMRTQKFDNTWRGPKEFRTFLQDTDKKLGQLLTSDAMRAVSQDRFSPMAYPRILMGLLSLAIASVCVWGSTGRIAAVSDKRMRHRYGFFRRCRAASTASGTPGVSTRPLVGARNFVTIVASVVAYGLLAETIGFVLLAGTMLLVMLLQFGTRVLPSLLITGIFVPSVYFVFAYVLRVPLPTGWLG